MATIVFLISYLNLAYLPVEAVMSLEPLPLQSIWSGDVMKAWFIFSMFLF